MKFFNITESAFWKTLSHILIKHTKLKKRPRNLSPHAGGFRVSAAARLPKGQPWTPFHSEKIEKNMKTFSIAVIHFSILFPQ